MVDEYNEQTGVARLTQRNKMTLSDEIELLTPGEVGKSIVISEMYNENNEPIESTPHPYMTFKMKSSIPLSEGDIIRAG